MNWWEGEGYEGLSIQEAQRQDDKRQEWDIQEANDTLSYDELKDLGIPRLSVSRLRSCDLHRHADPTEIVGPLYGGRVRRGL